MNSFDFYNIHFIFSFGASLIVFILAIYVLAKNSYALLNKSFAAFAFSVSLWAFGGALEAASLQLDAALAWIHIGAIGGILMGPLFFTFILTFIRNYRWLNNFFIQVITLGVSLALIVWTLFIEATPADLWYRVQWGWETKASITPMNFIASFLWVPFLMGVGLLFCWQFYLKSKDIKEKNQALLVVIAGAIPLILGFASQIAVPLFRFEAAEVVLIKLLFASSSLFLVAVLFYASLRYKLFTSLTPAATAEVIIESMKDALFVVNSRLEIDFINNSTSQMLGQEKNSLVGKSLLTIFSKKDWEEFKGNAIQKVYDNEEVSSLEIFLKKKDESSIPVSIQASGVKNEKGVNIGMIILAKDLRETRSLVRNLEEKSLELTENIKNLEVSRGEIEKTRLATLNILEDVEEARISLAEEKKRVETIILSLADGLLVLQDGKIALLNPATEEIFRIKKENAIEKSLEDFEQSANLKILSQFLAKNKRSPVLREEVVFRDPERIIQVSEIPISGGGDLIVLHDVSREKLIEQMKTEFVSLAAHQLRTPLSAIKWTLRMLLDGDLGRITKEQKDFVQKTYQSNERMISLINDLLNVTRIEEGKYLFKLEAVSVEEIIQPLIITYEEEAKRRKITLSFNKPKTKTPAIEVDKEKIGLAIENLINNAIRYTLPPGKVTVDLKCDKKGLEVSVKDSGVGVPKDQEDRIFTKFFRAANVIRMETEGSGLGLFITKNIVEAHGGKIWFESKEGEGTTFYISLPLKKSH